MRKLTKAEINTILETYQIKPGEFEQDSDDESLYKSRFVKYYWLRILKYDDDRVRVSCTDRTGRRTHVDVWERSKKYGIEWCDREIDGVPLSRSLLDSMEKIRELEEENHLLRKRIKELESRAEADHEKRSQKLSKSPGRPRETERIAEIVSEIGALKSQGLRDTEIMTRLRLSKPTFYRYKRLL